MSRPGFVYLLRHPAAGLFRIGRATCPAERAAALGGVAGGLCEVVHLIATDDAPRLAAALRRAYEPGWAAGGWFRLPAAAVEAIRGAAAVVYGAPAAAPGGSAGRPAPPPRPTRRRRPRARG